MTLNKLLAGAAMAALLSGAASAQSAFVDATSAFKPANVIANEAGQDLSGNLVLSFDIANVFATMGAGGAVDLEITVNNAVFSGVVLPNSLTNVAGGTACTFSVSPTLGGGSGANSVTYSSTGQINTCGASGEIRVSLPIFVDAGETISVSATFTATADAQGYGPVVNTVIDAEDIIVYGDALSYAFVPGAAANGELNPAGDAFLVPNPATNGVIGVLNTFYADTLFFNATQTLNAAGIAAEDLAADGEVTVSFTDATGIDVVTLDAAPCVAAGNAFTCAVDTSNVAGQEIKFELAGVLEPTVSQTPTASLSLTADVGVNADAAVFAGLPATALTPISLDNGRAVTAITTSAFEWVKVGSGGTESNFRIAFPTEAQANAVENVRVAVAAGNGVAAQTIELAEGTATTGFQVQGATITFNSRALGAVSGDDGNADVTEILLDHDETALLIGAVPGLSVKRQLVNRSPGSFVATPGLE